MLVGKRKEGLLILAFAIPYFIYNTYWLMKSVNWVLSFISTPNYEPPTGLLFTNAYSIFAVYLMDFVAFFGLVARFTGGFFAIACAYLVFKNTNNRGLVKKSVIILLLCEILYFLSLVPSVYFLICFSALSSLSNFLLSAQLFIEVLLITPFLTILANQIRKEKPTDKPLIMKWAGVSILSYEVALWIVYLLKWGELFNGANVTVSNAFTWLLISSRLLSLLNTTVILSLAVIFAAAGTKLLISNNINGKAIKYWSLSATFLGAFFIFYILYCIYLGVLWVIPFGEIWMTPLFVIGLYVLFANARNKA
jgi:hypothetical protein